nr:NYN domain-containing protein [Ammoniphilus resinae]
MSQFHGLGIEGIRPWKVFFQALHSVLTGHYGNCEVSYHFYGAIPPKHVDKERFYNRTRFFSALQKDDIAVHTGYCHVSENGEMFEKGVDMALGLDLYDLSLDKHDLLFIFSGDADLGPAIERAQKRGSKVVAILSERQPAKLIKKLVDGVVPLEAVIDLIDANYIVHRSNTQFTKKGEMSYVKS